MITRPLLAERAEELTDIQLPVIATPKLDGYRCLIIDGDAVSRNFKPIRNESTRERARKILPNGLDGELMLRENVSFDQISSAFSAHKGEPDFVFHAFDYVKDDPNKPYVDRLADLLAYEAANPSPHLVVVPFSLLETYDELVDFEEKCVQAGYEGSMYRKPNSRYKCGRSTLNEQILLKKKRWHDSEGLIVGFTEQEKNENEKEVNELGLTKRSTKKAGKVKAGTLGNFLMIDPTFPGQEIEVGTGIGWTKEFRKEVWENQDKYLNRIMTYKFQFEGTKDKPRFSSGRGFRDINDLDTTSAIARLYRSYTDPGKSEATLESFFE